MSRQYLSVTLAGYWRDQERAKIPDESGVYCVYGSEWDDDAQELSVHRLIYIGDSRNARYSIEHHPDRAKWESRLKPGEELCYSFGPVYYTMRERCVAALIFHHHPPGNSREEVASFPFDETEMVLSGKTRLLDGHYVLMPR